MIVYIGNNIYSALFLSFCFSISYLLFIPLSILVSTLLITYSYFHLPKSTSISVFPLLVYVKTEHDSQETETKSLIGNTEHTCTFQISPRPLKGVLVEWLFTGPARRSSIDLWQDINLYLSHSTQVR